MKKSILILLSVLLLTGCSIVRIDTDNIDNILNIILTKDNKLFNQVGKGYKYYLPSGVTYIESDNLNDILYCNGVYYYLYVDVVSYYNKIDIDYKENNNVYYSKKLSTDDGFKHSGYLEISKDGDIYYLKFIYNYATIEAKVKESELNDTVLNSAYILSTMKYNNSIIKLLLEDDYFTNRTGKYNNYNIKEDSGKFELQKN